MTQNCDNIYAEYGGKSIASAGIQGFGQSVAGLVGFSSFFHPVSNDALNNITADMDTLKQKFTTLQKNTQNKITQNQNQFLQDQLELIQDVEQFQEEILNEKIQKNTLLIAVTLLALIIVIIYLIIL